MSSKTVVDDETFDRVFKALSNSTRRRILDLLRDHPRTTGELCANFPDLDRCTTMQHLGVLERAGLLVAQRKGRERWNHLDVLPIKLIQDRWIGEYARSAVELLATLKSDTETSTTGRIFSRRVVPRDRRRAREETAMPRVIADITMSLDGYVTGPGADAQHGLGDAPELHTWVTEQDAVDTEILEQATAQSGAVIMGRRLFDTVDSPGGWNEDIGYGADQTGTPPFFVVTHSPPQDVRLERELGMRFSFVADLASAVDQARAAATHREVVIMGGGDVIGQALEQGLVDELRIHLAPMLLGGGTPLFKPGTRQMYRQRDIRPSKNAVHLAYERV